MELSWPSNVVFVGYRGLYQCTLFVCFPINLLRSGNECLFFKIFNLFSLFLAFQVKNWILSLNWLGNLASLSHYGARIHDSGSYDSMIFFILIKKEITNVRYEGMLELVREEFRKILYRVTLLILHIQSLIIDLCICMYH